MNEQVSSAVRSVLKVFGGYLVAKGVTDNSTVEIIVAGVVALVGVGWSWYTHQTPVKAP